MFEHSIRRSFVLRDKTAHWNDQVWPIYIGRLYTPAASLCKVETATRLLNFFLHLCQSQF